MAKKSNQEKNKAINSELSVNFSYKLGKFRLILDENTGNLKIYVTANREHMQITPKSDNSVLIHACVDNFNNKS